MNRKFRYPVFTGYGFCLFLAGCGSVAACLWCYYSGSPYPAALPFVLLALWSLIRSVQRRRFFQQVMTCLEKTESSREPKTRETIIRQCLEEMAKSRLEDDRIYSGFIQRIMACRDDDNIKTTTETNDRLRYVEQWIHDMKNPLAAIRLVCENNPSPTTISILKEVEIAEGYVAKSLSASKYLASDTLYNPRPIDLHEMVNGVIIRNKTRLIPLHIRVNIHDVDVNVTWEPKWLEMILNQLVQNSINYRGNADPEIEIFTEWRNGKLCLVVADNGIGIPENELSRIFEENYSGSNTGHNGRSTGMGLYLAMLLAKKGGAVLCAESVLGEWTRMMLLFPNE